MTKSTRGELLVAIVDLYKAPGGGSMVEGEQENGAQAKPAQAANGQ